MTQDKKDELIINKQNEIENTKNLRLEFSQP